MEPLHCSSSSDILMVVSCLAAIALIVCLETSAPSDMARGLFPNCSLKGISMVSAAYTNTAISERVVL